MNRTLLAVLCGCILALAALAAPVRGQTGPPPPPPPPNGGTPYPTPQPPCPPAGCPTNTPTVTPTPLPTNTPTATPTNTPIPLFVTVKLAHKTVAPGSKQKVTVATLPGAQVKITVAFPNKSKKTHSGTAGTGGNVSWSFKQPNAATSTNHTAKVSVSATNGTDTVKASKKYKIS